MQAAVLGPEGLTYLGSRWYSMLPNLRRRVGGGRIVGDRLLSKTGKGTACYSTGHIKAINDKRSFGDVQTNLSLTITRYDDPVTHVFSSRRIVVHEIGDI